MLIAILQEASHVITCFDACNPAPKTLPEVIESNKKEMSNTIILRYFPAKLGREIQILILDCKN